MPPMSREAAHLLAADLSTFRKVCLLLESMSETFRKLSDMLLWPDPAIHPGTERGVALTARGASRRKRRGSQ